MVARFQKKSTTVHFGEIDIAEWDKTPMQRLHEKLVELRKAYQIWRGLHAAHHFWGDQGVLKVYRYTKFIQRAHWRTDGKKTLRALAPLESKNFPAKIKNLLLGSSGDWVVVEDKAGVLPTCVFRYATYKAVARSCSVCNQTKESFLELLKHAEALARMERLGNVMSDSDTDVDSDSGADSDSEAKSDF